MRVDLSYNDIVVTRQALSEGRHIFTVLTFFLEQRLRKNLPQLMGFVMDAYVDKIPNAVTHCQKKYSANGYQCSF